MGQTMIKLAKADYVENKKIYWILIALAILIAIGVLFFYCFNINDPRAFVKIEDNVRIAEIKAHRFSSATSQLSIIYFIVLMVVFSKSFSSYFSKRFAVQTVLLPASRRDKFCYIVLRNVLFIPLFLMLVSSINNTIWSLALGIDYQFMNFGLSIRDMNIFLFQGTFLATFLVSSIYFKRYQFAFCWLLLFIAWGIYYFLSFFGVFLYQEKSIITTIVLLFVIIGMLYGVWWKYKNLQIN